MKIAFKMREVAISEDPRYLGREGQTSYSHGRIRKWSK